MFMEILKYSTSFAHKIQKTKTYSEFYISMYELLVSHVT